MTPTAWIAEVFRAWRIRSGSLQLGLPTRDCLEGRRTPDEGCVDASCESMPLTELEAGRRGVVTCLEDPASPAGRKLAAMGLLPGAAVRPRQRWPAWIVEVGHAELALDREMAKQVRVRAAEDGSASLDRAATGTPGTSETGL